MSIIRNTLNFFKNNLSNQSLTAGIFIVPLLLTIFIPILFIAAIVNCISSCFSSNNYPRYNNQCVNRNNGSWFGGGSWLGGLFDNSWNNPSRPYTNRNFNNAPPAPYTSNRYTNTNGPSQPYQAPTTSSWFANQPSQHTSSSFFGGNKHVISNFSDPSAPSQGSSGGMGGGQFVG